MNYLKIFLFVVSTILNSYAFTLSNAYARDYIDAMTFGQLAKEDQRQLISTTQQLFANIEEEQIKVYRRKNKYTSLQYLLNLMVQNAYAQNIVGPEGSQQICIYAGWVSYMQGGKCRHPLLVDKTTTTFKNLSSTHQEFIQGNHTNYDNLKSFCPKGKSADVMVCNPKLFGTKDDGKPFCSIGNTNPYNSSYGCLKQIDKYIEAKTKDIADATERSKKQKEIKNKILDGVISAGLQGSSTDLDSLNNMLLLNYDICMCKGSGHYIEMGYAQKIYNQRTCYAWLYQTKEIIGRMKTRTCRDLDALPYQKSKANDKETIMTMLSWANKAYDNLNADILKDSSDSSNYFNYDIKDDKKWIEGRPTVDASQCPIHADENIIAKLDDSSMPDYSLVVGEVVGLKLGQPQNGWSFTPADIDQTDLNKAHEKDKNKMYFKRLDKDYTVTVKLKDFPEGKDVTIPSLDKKTITNKCELAITEDTRQAPEDNPSANDDGITKDKVAKDENGKGPQNKEEKTDVADAPADDTPKPTSSGNTADTDWASKPHVKIVVSVPTGDKEGESLDLTSEKIKIEWKGAIGLKEKDKIYAYYTSDQKEKEVSALVEINSETKYSCSLEIPDVKKGGDDPQDDGIKYNIKLSQKDKDSKTVNVIAKVTDADGNEIDDLSAKGLTINWSKTEKTQSDKKKKEDDKKEEDTKDNSSDGLSDSQSQKEEKKDSSRKSIKDKSTELKIAVERSENKQTIYATLMKKDKKQGEDNEEISPLKEDSPARNLANDKPQTINPGNSGQFLQKSKGVFFGNR